MAGAMREANPTGATTATGDIASDGNDECGRPANISPGLIDVLAVWAPCAVLLVSIFTT